MKISPQTKTPLKYFLLGLITAVSLLILTGAGTGGAMNGRYQISAWSGSFGPESGGCGAFIVDTATGATKTAYTIIYGPTPQRSVLVNNLRQPFTGIR